MADPTPEQKALETIQADLQKTAVELGAELKKRDDQIATQGKASEETASRVNQLFDQVKSLQEAQAEHAKSLQKRVDDMEALMKRPGGGGADPEQKSIGARFVESEARKLFLGSGVKNINMGVEGSLLHRKTLLDTGQISPQIQRDPMIVVPERVLRMRDLLPSDRTSTPQGEYYEETGFNAGTTQAVTSITQTAGLATITTTAAHGWGSIGEFAQVTLAGANQADYVGSFRMKIVTSTTATFAVDSGATTPATGTIVAYKQQTHGAAAPVAEGSLKPEARMQLTLRNWIAQFIAHWLPATRQVLSDNDQLRAFIDNRLLYGLDFVIERQLLYGDGSSPNLQGILTHPRVQSYAWSEGPLTTDTQIDAIRRAMTRALLAEYPVTGLVVHPYDWESIELMKGSDDHYLAISMIDSAGISRFFRVPAVETPSIEAGTSLVGAFAQGGQIWDMEEGNIRVADQHSDHFVKNMVAILAEARLGVAWYRPEAFVKVTLDQAPSA